MIRYHVVIGLAEVMGKVFPIIRCDILATDEASAEAIAEYMGMRIFELKEADRLEEYQTYQKN